MLSHFSRTLPLGDACRAFDFQVTANPFLAISWHCWEQAVDVGTAPRDWGNITARGGLACPLGSCLGVWSREHLVGDQQHLCHLGHQPCQSFTMSWFGSSLVQPQKPWEQRLRATDSILSVRRHQHPHGSGWHHLDTAEFHGWDGLELSPSSCHFRGHFIPDTILSPAHSRDIQPGLRKTPQDTNPLCLGCVSGQEC